jgi:hypothetical protein
MKKKGKTYRFSFDHGILGMSVRVRLNVTRDSLRKEIGRYSIAVPDGVYGTVSYEPASAHNLVTYVWASKADNDAETTETLAYLSYMAALTMLEHGHGSERTGAIGDHIYGRQADEKVLAGLQAWVYAGILSRTRLLE